MNHRIRVATIIINDNKLLLVKHVHPETGYEWWVPPGGGMEECDSSLFECAKREAFEETNLTIETSKILYIREFYSEETRIFNIELFTLADSFQGETSLENIEGKGPDEQYIKGVAWFSKEELRGVTVFPEILRDEFWDDFAAGFPDTTYLGRQIEKKE